MSAATFTEFVAICFDGNQTKAGEALGLQRSHVSRICKGTRSITPALAARIEEVSEGRYTKEALIWPEGEAA
jgi:plasmid maintenance system antidote protein VapI